MKPRDRITIMCRHDFKPTHDLPPNKWRCVKCANLGYMDVIQTQNLTAQEETLMRAKHRIAVFYEDMQARGE